MWFLEILLFNKQIIDIISHAKRFHVEKHFDYHRKKLSSVAEKPKESKSKDLVTKKIIISQNLIYNILFIAGFSVSFLGLYTSDYNSLIGGSLLMILSLVFRYFK